MPATSCGAFAPSVASFIVSTCVSPFESGHTPTALPFRKTAIERADPPRTRASMTGDAPSAVLLATSSAPATNGRLTPRANTRAHVAPSRSTESMRPPRSVGVKRARVAASPRSTRTPRWPKLQSSPLADGVDRRARREAPARRSRGARRRSGVRGRGVARVCDGRGNPPPRARERATRRAASAAGCRRPQGHGVGVEVDGARRAPPRPPIAHLACGARSTEIDRRELHLVRPGR